MDIKQTLLDKILQDIDCVNNEYTKSNENKKAHLIEINPDSYSVLKKDIEAVMNQPIKQLGKLMDCKIAIVENLNNDYRIT
jgi:hypothetical protein